MQQVLKVKGVHRRKFKVLLITVAMLLISTFTKSQNQDFSFQLSFIKKFKYPESLKNSCASTFTNIIIEISQKGTVDEINVSDSAPSIFKDEFDKIKTNLDLAFLRKVITDNQLKNCTIIIPVFYTYVSDYCVNSFDNPGYLSENYFLVNGKKMDKLSFNLKPIINTMHKPIH